MVEPKLFLGRILLTEKIAEREETDQDFKDFVNTTISDKYMNCDWGDTDDLNCARNDWNIQHGGRIAAYYIYPNNSDNSTIVLISTEADRYETIVQFPTEQ